MLKSTPSIVTVSFSSPPKIEPKSNAETEPIAKIASGKPKKPDEERVRVDNLKRDGIKWFDEMPKESLVIKSTNFDKILHANLILPEKESNIFVFVINFINVEL